MTCEGGQAFVVCACPQDHAPASTVLASRVTRERAFGAPLTPGDLSSAGLTVRARLKARPDKRAADLYTSVPIEVKIGWTSHLHAALQCYVSKN